MKTDKIIAGLIVTAIGIWAMVSWWWFVTDVIKGLTAISLVFIGLIVIGLGLKDRTENFLRSGVSDETETE